MPSERLARLCYQAVCSYRRTHQCRAARFPHKLPANTNRLLHRCRRLFLHDAHPSIQDMRHETHEIIFGRRTLAPRVRQQRLQTNTTSRWCRKEVGSSSTTPTARALLSSCDVPRHFQLLGDGVPTRRQGASGACALRGCARYTGPRAAPASCRPLLIHEWLFTPAC